MSDDTADINEINKNIGEIGGVLIGFSNSFYDFKKDYSGLMNVLRNIESLLEKIEKKIK
jgi:archaellum component FlaC